MPFYVMEPILEYEEWQGSRRVRSKRSERYFLVRTPAFRAGFKTPGDAKRAFIIRERMRAANGANAKAARRREAMTMDQDVIDRLFEGFARKHQLCVRFAFCRLKSADVFDAQTGQKRG